MDEVKAMTKAKQSLRDLIAHVNTDIGNNAGQHHNTAGQADPGSLNLTGGNDGFYTGNVNMPDASSGQYKEVQVKLSDKPVTDNKQLQSIKDNLKDRLDSMNEMSEMTSLRLQMMMDRRSKFISTLSNIMKKISQTQDTLVQNLN
jgi:hypothetical protein